MNSKRTVAIVLAIAMLLGAVSMASAATVVAEPGFADSQDSGHAHAIGYLKAFGVLRGDAGTDNVRPGDALSREEFVVIVARATGHESVAAGLGGFKPNFTDADQISDWAVGAVNLATSQGWIKGFEDGTFRPKASLTMAEAITVLVRATGYELTVPSTAVWPVGHLIAANTAGITAGLTVNANAPITREDMARMTFNAMFVATAYLDGGGRVQTDGSMLAEASAIIHVGRVDDIAPGTNGLRLEVVIDPTTAPPTVEFRDLMMADSVVLIGGNTLHGLRDLQVRATENVAGEVIIIEVLAGQSGASTFKAAIGGTASARTGMELSDGSTFTVTESTTINVNNANFTIGPDAGDEWASVHEFLTHPDSGMQVGDEVVAAVDGNGIALSLRIIRLNKNRGNLYPANDMIHERTITAGDGPNELVVYDPNNNPGVNPGVFYTAEVPKDTPVWLNGQPATFADLAPGDVVRSAVQGFNNEFIDDGRVLLKISATREVVSGSVDSIVAKAAPGGDWYAYIRVKQADGTIREVAWTRPGNSAANVVADVPVSVGDNVRLALNHEGEAVRDLGYQTSTKDVKVVSVWSEGPNDYVDIDDAGTLATYRVTDNLAKFELGSVGTMTHNANGTTDFDAADWTTAIEGTVQQVLEGNIVLYKDTGGTTQVAPTNAVYQANAGFNGAAGFIGADALSSGDTIRVAANGAGRLFIIKK